LSLAMVFPTRSPTRKPDEKHWQPKGGGGQSSWQL